MHGRSLPPAEHECSKDLALRLGGILHLQDNGARIIPMLNLRMRLITRDLRLNSLRRLHLDIVI